MPTISVFYGILIQMFWQEHAPPHFHALYGEFEALIDIRTFEVIRGFFPRRAVLWVTPVRNSSRYDSKPSGALTAAEIILKSTPAAAAGPEGLPPGHEPFLGGAWPGGSSEALFLTG